MIAPYHVPTVARDAPLACATGECTVAPHGNPGQVSDGDVFCTIQHHACFHYRGAEDREAGAPGEAARQEGISAIEMQRYFRGHNVIV